MFYQAMYVLKNVPKPVMKCYNVEEFFQMYDLVTFNLVSPITIVADVRGRITTTNPQ